MNTLVFFCDKISRTEPVEFELKDSWVDFFQYVLGMDDDEEIGDESAPSFSKVMARVVSTDPSTVESDEEVADHTASSKNSFFIKWIPDWVVKSN